MTSLQTMPEPSSSWYRWPLTFLPQGARSLVKSVLVPTTTHLPIWGPIVSVRGAMVVAETGLSRDGPLMAQPLGNRVNEKSGGTPPAGVSECTNGTLGQAC